MKLRLSPRAEDDLDRIAAYLEPRDPQAARLAQQAIAAALQTELHDPHHPKRSDHHRERTEAVTKVHHPF